eukprot:768221-Hanusia_phi.AAC.2
MSWLKTRSGLHEIPVCHDFFTFLGFQPEDVTKVKFARFVFNGVNTTILSTSSKSLEEARSDHAAGVNFLTSPRELPSNLDGDGDALDKGDVREKTSKTDLRRKLEFHSEDSYDLVSNEMQRQRKTRMRLTRLIRHLNTYATNVISLNTRIDFNSFNGSHQESQHRGGRSRIHANL